jgi:hypothetical protein
LSLDKWIKSKKKKEENKKKPQHKASNDKTQIQTSIAKPTRKHIKYNLLCPKKKCAYQKTIMKKQLMERDKICPKCKSIMKIRTI